MEAQGLAIANHDEPHALAVALLASAAQLLDLLAAQQSPEVTAEHEQRGSSLPHVADRDRSRLVIDQLDALE